VSRANSPDLETKNMELNGLSAVVTGAASGLGAATARALAKQGVKVAIFDRNAEKGEAIAAEIGGLFCNVDVTSDESVDAGFAKARAAHGQERILVNCAGVGNAFKTAGRSKETGEIKHFPLDAFNMVIQINLVGTFRCIAKSAAGMLTLDPMQDGERGVVVNTASVAAVDGQMGQAAYSASKGGIVGMTLPVARDLMSEGIRVNTILPGIFDTPLMQGAPDKVKETLAASVPFPKRFGRPDEYASLALEMCRNSYFNGEHVRLDGAIRMPPR
jgi:NAD(P)-dependent dehydrogenase (short-subunit alcohol dehydrogenase family)